ncbi:iron(III) transport system permease protein [Bradymonas sediminis]|nr:iron(III) transport system permease protein [Bradymonas sediminis]
MGARALGGLLGVVVVAPFIWLVLRAWGGADQAGAILFNSAMLEAVVASLTLAAAVSIVCVLIALPLAWLTHATDMPARRHLRRIMVLPLAVPSYVSGFVVVALLGPSGLASDLGLPLPDVYGFFGAFVALLFVYPYVLLPLQAAMARVDPRTWEAARSLGASPLRAFREIILPAVRPAATRGGLLVGLYVLGDFGAVSLLRFPSLSYLIYVRYSSPFMRHEAVWYAFVLMLVALAFLAAGALIERRPKQARNTGTIRPWPVIALGPYRWVAFAFCVVVAGFGALLPIGVVGWWLIRGMAQGNTLIPLYTETLNSLGLAAGAAVLITFVGLIPALLHRFDSGRFSRFLDRSVHVGYTLPGIVVALALVYMGTRGFPWLYHTVWMLQLAYLIRFLPQASTTMADGLSQQNPRLYEAARSLGQSPMGAIRRVVLPVALPSLAAAGLAVFISVIKELPATILLKPPGFSTLAQRIWSLTQDAFFTATAPTVFVLLSLALGALWLRPDTDLRGQD